MLINILIDIDHFSFQRLDSNWSQYSQVNMVPFHYRDYNYYVDDDEPTRKMQNIVGFE